MRKRETFRHGSFTTTVEYVPEGVDPRKYLEEAMHDCPDCQAALARGETPTFGTGDDLPPPLRPSGLDRFRRPRWRDLKRRVRR